MEFEAVAVATDRVAAVDIEGEAECRKGVIEEVVTKPDYDGPVVIGQYKRNGYTTRYDAVVVAERQSHFSDGALTGEAGGTEKGIEAIAEPEDIVDTRMDIQCHPAPGGIAVAIICVVTRFIVPFFPILDAVLDLDLEFSDIDEEVVESQGWIIGEKDLDGMGTGGRAAVRLRSIFPAGRQQGQEGDQGEGDSAK